MLVDIQSFILDAGRNTQAVQLLDAEEEEETAGSSPKIDDEHAEALGSEEAPAVTVQSAVRGGEQARHERTQDAANTMY